MFTQTFRNTAKRYGTYCPAKNVLRVRKGRKTYHFTCDDRELRFAAPGHQEIVVLISSDASPRELRRCIDHLIGSS